VWLYGEVIDGGLARTEPIGNREIGIFDVKRLGSFVFAKPRTPIRDEAWVMRQRSHRLRLSLKS
jgi:hypothetical protein